VLIYSEKVGDITDQVPQWRASAWAMSAGGWGRLMGRPAPTSVLASQSPAPTSVLTVSRITLASSFSKFSSA
jgi:hypothetical protein